MSGRSHLAWPTPSRRAASVCDIADPTPQHVESDCAQELDDPRHVPDPAATPAGSSADSLAPKHELANVLVATVQERLGIAKAILM
jgi:hypothetical protein